MQALAGVQKEAESDTETKLAMPAAKTEPTNNGTNNGKKGRKSPRRGQDR